MNYQYLKNNRNLKAFFKGASANEIKLILDKLNEFYEIVKSNEDHEALIKAQKQEFLSGLLNSLDEHNFTIDDLQAFKGIKAKENRPKMKPRYAYIALDGAEYLWSGQGKIPTKMQEVMKRDGITNKDHYLISDEN